MYIWCWVQVYIHHFIVLDFALWHSASRKLPSKVLSARCQPSKIHSFIYHERKHHKRNCSVCSTKHFAKIQLLSDLADFGLILKEEINLFLHLFLRIVCKKLLCYFALGNLIYFNIFNHKIAEWSFMISQSSNYLFRSDLQKFSGYEWMGECRKAPIGFGQNAIQMQENSVQFDTFWSNAR